MPEKIPLFCARFPGESWRGRIAARCKLRIDKLPFVPEAARFFFICQHRANDTLEHGRSQAQHKYYAGSALKAYAKEAGLRAK
jgi:hypothetical protein